MLYNKWVSNVAPSIVQNLQSFAAIVKLPYVVGRFHSLFSQREITHKSCKWNEFSWNFVK